MKLFEREQRSLFGEILDWMLTPLLLLWPASLVLTWLVAQGIATKPFDRALEHDVQALARLIAADKGRVVLNLPGAASEILRADSADLIYYQVLGARGEVVSGEQALPLPPEDEKPAVGAVRWRDDKLRGLEIRVAYTWVGVSAEGAQPALVQVAETLEKRSQLATEIIKGVMLPQFLILPLAVLLVWLALERGMRPLNALEQRIRRRESDDLSPIDASDAPTEVAPLVSSINDLLMRLKSSIATQKRFLTDAAHQLKTPLAGLRMQADLALRHGTNEDELKQSLKLIGRSSVRATNMVNQLLALARAESAGRAVPAQSLNLAQLVIEVVQDSVPHALDKNIDLGYEGLTGGDALAQIQGHAVLLKEAVRNLVNNALHYTPSSSERTGIVTVRVQLAAASTPTLMLQVEDNGPGIPAPERAHVLEPFYRASHLQGSETDGSGLGLAIVQEVAQMHSASLTLEDTHPGQNPPGLRLTLRFKAAPANASSALKGTSA
jgi:two-component system, OmpR family, sensor histidine kinase TctE